MKLQGMQCLVLALANRVGSLWRFASGVAGKLFEGFAELRNRSCYVVQCHIDLASKRMQDAA